MKHQVHKFCSNHKETINNFLWRALQVLGKQGINFLIFTLCAKLLPPDEFGTYNYLIAFIMLLMIFSDLGISAATSKYAAEYNATDKVKLKYLLFNSLLILVVSGIIVTTLTIIFGREILKDKYEFAIYVLPLIILAPISSLYDGIFRGLKRFKELAIVSLSVGCLSILIVYILISKFGIIGALISQSIFYIISICTLAIVYKSIYFKLDKSIIKQIFKYSLVIGISSVAYYLYSKVDILVLEHYNYNVEIGYYELANRIVSLLMLPFIMFAQVIAPNITSKYSCGAYEYLRYRFKTYCLWTIVLSAGIAGLCYLVYPLIMKKFLNEYMVDNFIIMINVLLVLFVLRTLGAAIVTQGFATPTGHAYINMRILLFTGPLNLLLDVVLIKKFGFIGVVYATFIVLIINHTLLLTIYYLKVLKRGK